MQPRPPANQQRPYTARSAREHKRSTSSSRECSPGAASHGCTYFRAPAPPSCSHWGWGVETAYGLLRSVHRGSMLDHLWVKKPVQGALRPAVTRISSAVSNVPKSTLNDFVLRGRYTVGCDSASTR